MRTRDIAMISIFAIGGIYLYNKSQTPPGKLPHPLSLPPGTKPLPIVKPDAPLLKASAATKTAKAAKKTLTTSADYEVVLPANIPPNHRPWTRQVLEEAKQKILSGENFNQLWTHDNLRVRLVLSDKPLQIQAGNIRMNIGNGALAVDGGRFPALNYIVKTIDEMATHYGRRIRYTNNNGMMNGISGVDLLASALQS